MKASFNAEMYAAVACGQHVEWVRDAATEMGFKIDGSTIMSGDNQAVLMMSRPGAVPAKSKPDSRRVGILQELSRPGGPVAPAKVHTDMNKVDFLTKHVGAAKQISSMKVVVVTKDKINRSSRRVCRVVAPWGAI